MDRISAQPNLEGMEPVEVSSPSPAIPIQLPPSIYQYQRSVTPQVGGSASVDSLQQVGTVPMKRGTPMVSLADQGNTTATTVASSTTAVTVIRNITTGATYTGLASGSVATASTLPARTSVSATTASIANNANANVQVSLGKTFNVLAVTADHPCRVRLYANSTFQTADSARGQVTPTVNAQHGVILDLVMSDAAQFTPNRTWICSPEAMGSDLSTTPNGSMNCTITNLSGVTQAITVTFAVLTEEGNATTTTVPVSNSSSTTTTTTSTSSGSTSGGAYSPWKKTLVSTQ